MSDESELKAQVAFLENELQRLMSLRDESVSNCVQGRRKVGDRGDMSPPLFIQGGTTYRLSPPTFQSDKPTLGAQAPRDNAQL